MTLGGARCGMEGAVVPVCSPGRMRLERCRWGVDTLQLGCQLSVWIPRAPTGGSWPRSGEEEAGGPGV